MYFHVLALWCFLCVKPYFIYCNKCCTVCTMVTVVCCFSPRSLWSFIYLSWHGGEILFLMQQPCTRIIVFLSPLRNGIQCLPMGNSQIIKYFSLWKCPVHKNFRLC
jgi:hypothetical protein